MIFPVLLSMLAMAPWAVHAQEAKPACLTWVGGFGDPPRLFLGAADAEGLRQQQEPPPGEKMPNVLTVPANKLPEKFAAALDKEKIFRIPVSLNGVSKPVPLVHEGKITFGLEGDGGEDGRTWSADLNPSWTQALVLFHTHAGKSGPWRAPAKTAINLSPEAVPGGTAILVNLSTAYLYAAVKDIKVDAPAGATVKLPPPEVDGTGRFLLMLGASRGQAPMILAKRRVEFSPEVRYVVVVYDSVTSGSPLKVSYVLLRVPVAPKMKD